MIPTSSPPRNANTLNSLAGQGEDHLLIGLVPVGPEQSLDQVPLPKGERPDEPLLQGRPRLIRQPNDVSLLPPSSSLAGSESDSALKNLCDDPLVDIIIFWPFGVPFWVRPVRPHKRSQLNKHLKLSRQRPESGSARSARSAHCTTVQIL